MPYLVDGRIVGNILWVRVSYGADWSVGRFHHLVVCPCPKSRIKDGGKWVGNGRLKAGSGLCELMCIALVSLSTDEGRACEGSCHRSHTGSSEVISKCEMVPVSSRRILEDDLNANRPRLDLLNRFHVCRG